MIAGNSNELVAGIDCSCFLCAYDYPIHGLDLIMEGRSSVLAKLVIGLDDVSVLHLVGFTVR